MKIFNFKFNHSKIYYFGLILTAICLPLSKLALSISMIFLISNWVLELDFKRKLDEIKSKKAILIFVGIFLIHVIWLLNTQNFKYAFNDLGNKAILVLFPVIIGTSKEISEKQIKSILVWFTLAVVSSTIISTLILVEAIDYPVGDIRDISAFMSHIRLSLLINISIYSLGYILFSKKFFKTSFELGVYIVFIVWLVIFLYLLKSFTGIFIFFITLFLVLGFVSLSIKYVVPRLFLQVSLITIFLLLASYITHSISKFYTTPIVDFENLDEFTQSGNAYSHIKGVDQLENGSYLSIYICEQELEKEWNNVSSIPYFSRDQKGQEIKYTLMRYLTSKAYRKDSVGISKLSVNDIKNIESGMANYIFENKYAIYPKIYEIIWQIDVYKKGFNPAGNSITLRAEFVKTAYDIIQNNFWFGVGTGDVMDSFNLQYKANKSRLPKQNRLRAHNQFVTFFLSFGVVGFVLILFSMFYPVIRFQGHKNYLFIVFFIIALLSFLNEDTLETQIGITLFSYFYSLFLFGSKTNIKNIE
ncbi:MAG: O-antigen ligase family protein [Bacteroidales bacterium]|jgi:hypothetical protein|nr:O-antigen ligase family protein [Bacteroidales bacterium]